VREYLYMCVVCNMLERVSVHVYERVFVTEVGSVCVCGGGGGGGGEYLSLRSAVCEREYVLVCV
jgi:hypothetical protein